MTITQGFHRALQQRPDATAVCFESRRQTFREFGLRVARLAGALRQLGMRPGDRVAMLALNSDRYLEYQLGVPWGRGVLNPCNVRWSAAEILFALDDSGSTILIFDDAFASMIDTIRSGSKSVRQFIYAGEHDAPAGAHSYEALVSAATPVADESRIDDTVGVFYTGGTTGFPKGVMLSHANLLWSAAAVAAEGFTSGDTVYLHAAPMFHLADYGTSQFHWLRCSTHCIISAFQPEKVALCIQRHRVTDLFLVPTMIQMLVDHPTAPLDCDLSSLKCVLYGGSPINEALLDRAMATLPGVKFFQAYGMTELSPCASFLPPEYHTRAGRERGKIRSAGRAHSYCQLRIVDADDNELPRGSIGEIVVRGPNVMQGYWNKPEQTATALRNGWMHTGDVAYMDDDGFIFVVDRMKDMVITGGENVYSTEVENALATHSAISACAVIGIPSDEWGEAVHAAVVLKAGHDVTAEQLIAHCRSRLAHYKCPRTIAFLNALPVSGAGKVLKSQLREPFWRGRDRRVG